MIRYEHDDATGEIVLVTDNPQALADVGATELLERLDPAGDLSRFRVPEAADDFNMLVDRLLDLDADAADALEGMI